MRQECRILTGNRKFLIIFIATTIVLTYGYEGMISSLVTVAPPVMGYNKLKVLLDGGYKILAGDLVSLRQFIELFNAENITGAPEDWVERVPYGPDSDSWR